MSGEKKKTHTYINTVTESLNKLASSQHLDSSTHNKKKKKIQTKKKKRKKKNIWNSSEQFLLLLSVAMQFFSVSHCLCIFVTLALVQFQDSAVEGSLTHLRHSVASLHPQPRTSKTTPAPQALHYVLLFLLQVLHREPRYKSHNATLTLVNHTALSCVMATATQTCGFLMKWSAPPPPCAKACYICFAPKAAVLQHDL